jgi:hypothetical protein
MENRGGEPFNLQTRAPLAFSSSEIGRARWRLGFDDFRKREVRGGFGGVYRRIYVGEEARNRSNRRDFWIGMNLVRAMVSRQRSGLTFGVHPSERNKRKKEGCRACWALGWAAVGVLRLARALG